MAWKNYIYANAYFIVFIFKWDARRGSEFAHFSIKLREASVFPVEAVIIYIICLQRSVSHLGRFYRQRAF